MNPKTALNQVKMQVRKEALVRRVFTVADIVDATGLNPESVRTELQRMKEQKLLASERRGKQCQYSLATDPEMRLALSQSLYTFLLPAVSLANLPVSDAYKQAQQRLDTALNTEGDCSQLLVEAKELLEQAAQEEGHVSASEAVLSYLGYERARLAYLSGKHTAAERSFQALRPFFESIHDMDMVCYIDEFLLIIRQLASDSVSFAMEGPGRELREYLRQHRSRGPLLPRLVNMLDQTPHRTSNMAIASTDYNAAKAFFGERLNPLPAALAA